MTSKLAITCRNPRMSYMVVSGPMPCEKRKWSESSGKRGVSNGREKNKTISPPRGSNSQPSDRLVHKSLTLYPIELGGRQ